VKLFEIGGISVGEAAFAGQPGPPTLDRLEISGPYNATGVGETPSRQRIFVCRPARAVDEEPCASRILSTVARRAFRRDVTTADARPFLTAYAAARRTHSFDASIAAALRDLLLAPDFLFVSNSIRRRLPVTAQKVSIGSRLPSLLLFVEQHSG
jgi:hypothetical protein